MNPIISEKTIRFLKSLQHKDGAFDSVKVAYYVIKSLSSLDSTPAKPITSIIGSFNHILKVLESPSTYVEIMSELETIHLAVDLLRDLKIPVNSKRVIKQILKCRNSDGSFGSRRHSRIASTYHALETLRILKYNTSLLKETLNWIRRCEIPSGGFVSSPDITTGYLEDTYFGAKIMEIINENFRFPRETLKYITKFQNPNGGFRRSIFLGISDLESTFQAVSSIQTILSSEGI